MATIQIDRLLETVVRQKASDLHLVVGRPPCLRLHGGIRELQTKPLEAEVETVLVSIPVYIITLINPAEYRNGSA